MAAVAGFSAAAAAVAVVAAAAVVVAVVAVAVAVVIIEAVAPAGWILVDWTIRLAGTRYPKMTGTQRTGGEAGWAHPHSCTPLGRRLEVKDTPRPATGGASPYARGSETRSPGSGGRA